MFKSPRRYDSTSSATALFDDRSVRTILKWFTISFLLTHHLWLKLTAELAMIVLKLSKIWIIQKTFIPHCIRYYQQWCNTVARIDAQKHCCCDVPLNIELYFLFFCNLHSPIRPWQPVSHLISTISYNYTSHHELSVLQASNYSKYHIYLQILVGASSATARLQHGIPFLLSSKIVRPYIVSSAT